MLDLFCVYRIGIGYIWDAYDKYGMNGPNEIVETNNYSVDDQRINLITRSPIIFYLLDCILFINFAIVFFYT